MSVVPVEHAPDCNLDFAAWVHPAHRESVGGLTHICSCVSKRMRQAYADAGYVVVPGEDELQVLRAVGWPLHPGLVSAWDAGEGDGEAVFGHWSDAWPLRVLAAWEASGRSFYRGGIVAPRLAWIMRKGRVAPEWVAGGEGVARMSDAAWLDYLLAGARG